MRRMAYNCEKGPKPRNNRPPKHPLQRRFELPVSGYLKEPVFGEQGIGFDGAIDGQF